MLTASSLEPAFNEQPAPLLGHENAVLHRSEAGAQISPFVVTSPATGYPEVTWRSAMVISSYKKKTSYRKVRSCGDFGPTVS